MVVIRPYQTSVTLFCCDGRVWHYASKKEALKDLGRSWISRNVGEHFRAFSHSNIFHPAGHEATLGWRLQGNPTYSEPVYREASFIMRDDAGRPLMAGDFPRAPEDSYLFNRFRIRYGRWNGEGPVPGVSKRRGGWHYYRRIRHINDLRGMQFFPEEGEVGERAYRKNRFGDPWHEVHVAARENDNWKRYRRTQWKD